MTELIMRVNDTVNGIVWGPWMLALLVGTGVYLSIRTGFIQVGKFGYIMRNTVGSLFKKDKKADSGKNLSAFQAVTTALAGTVGTGNIAGVTGAIVMNANPFTLGHQYLAEKAASECDLLHIFVVSEDASLVPFRVRKDLVKKGTAHLNNVVLHDSGPYIISNATFPSYFLKDEAAVIDGHARLDLAIFAKISETLGINVRYVGEEPNSQVTGIYNDIMAKSLPDHGIECMIIPRKEADGKVISASTVRQALQNDDYELLKTLVPGTTYEYFLSLQAQPLIKKIKAAGNVIHY